VVGPSLRHIENRAALLGAIREYFQREKVMEVTTPVLGAFGVSEPHLENIQVGNLGYLQTSPEFAMKKLIALHQRSVYQVCPAFRGSEQGARHRGEFQMLEWYRVGFSLDQLMADLVALLNFVSERVVGQSLAAAPTIVSYREIFEAQYAQNPHELTAAAAKCLLDESLSAHLGDSATLADYLDALFSSIERQLVSPTLVYDFPVCQAALAEETYRQSGDTVANRFELYMAGVEIANAYQELNDPVILKRRFDLNNALRRQDNKPVIADDQAFLSLVEKLPFCAGIALGVDRLLMVLLGLDSLEML
jgi:lysyl-tRNA synthetase class 2